MKRTQDIIGLPIVSISEGQEVGHVKNIIVNADKGKIDYLIVDSGVQILSARVVSAESIVGIGEYAVTVENQNAINDIGKIPAAIELLRKNIEVKGAKVLTTKGQLVGEVGEYFFDKDTFRIIGLEYVADITQKKVRIIPRESVITFGVNFVIVGEDMEDDLVDKSGQIGKAYLDSDNPQNDEMRQQATDYANMILQDLNSSDDNTADNTDDSTDENDAPTNIPEQNDNKQQYKTEKLDNAAELFEQKQRQYLVNRYATRTVVDNNGNAIIKAGEKITEQVIDAAKANGKLIELVMNNKSL